ncbi:MAG: hypothetical protein OEZ39_13400 [Gammaproteobacteria bacterium]|nr:hypothetical protein [Gammaproteobacteria bacterium]MDH5652846.1 hypothetical protein [Gammaproteobacteria bacterium]
MNENEKKALYERLYVSLNDLHMAKQYAEWLIKKGWHSAPYERRGSIYMQQSAFTTSLIVSYCRPFTKSKGWPKLPSEFVVYSAEESVLHRKIMDLRHQVYAHSDSEKYSIRPWKISEDVFTDIVGEPFRRVSADECAKLVKMIAGVSKRIRPRLTVLQRELLGEKNA